MKNLKKIRIENKMTQQEVAKNLNISHATYWGYETGKYEPSNDMLKALSKLFNTSIDYLLENTRNEKIIDLSILSKKKQLLIKEILEADDYDLDGIFEDYIAREVNKEANYPDYKMYKDLTLKESEKHLNEREEEQATKINNKDNKQ